MNEQIDSVRYLYLNATGSLSSGSYLICFICVAALSTATFGLVILYDGQDTGDPVILNMAVYLGQSRSLNIVPPIQVNDGLYVVVPTNYYVTIGYIPLS